MLLDTEDNARAHAPPHLRVRFHASRSVASEVAYDDTDCDHLSDAETVQEALDALCRNSSILYVGGDGQEALPGEILPAPLRVRVSNGGWPVAGATVRFEAETGRWNRGERSPSRSRPRRTA